MNVELDETEFYHQDFTTATDWEVFIARLEEVIYEWRAACATEEITNFWAIKEEKVSIRVCYCCMIRRLLIRDLFVYVQYNNFNIPVYAIFGFCFGFCADGG